MGFDSIKIGFLGTGRMATALATGFTRHLVAPNQILGADPSEASRAAFQTAIGGDCEVAADAVEGLSAADVLFLAVKPQVMGDALNGITEILDGKLIVSIAAGITINTLSQWIPASCRLIRVMPNTPCLVGAGACGVSRAESATDDDEALVIELLKSVGVVESVPEKLLDAVSKGSGDSFVLRNHGRKAMAPRAFPEKSFSPAYVIKDIDCVFALARDEGVALPAAGAVRRYYAAAVESGSGDRYFPCVIEQVESGAPTAAESVSANEEAVT